MGLGTSMGAGLLLKYAAKAGQNCVLRGIAAAGTPFDYAIIRQVLQNWWPYFGYSDQFIIAQVKERFYAAQPELITMKDELHEKGINLEEVANSKTSKEFDTKFTIRVCGYESTEEYYNDASVVHALHKIQVPVLALSSKDDPIVSSKCIPYEKVRGNPNIVLAVTELGGHIGWYTGVVPERWYAKPCLEFLDALIE